MSITLQCNNDCELTKMSCISYILVISIEYTSFDESRMSSYVTLMSKINPKCVERMLI